MSRVCRRRSARRDGRTSMADGWSGPTSDVVYMVSPGGYPRVRARRLPGIRLLRLQADTRSSGGPRLVFHCRPIPSCRHEFCDHGRDRRSHRRGSAVSACISNPRRDTSPCHGKRETQLTAVRALSSAPACGVGSPAAQGAWLCSAYKMAPLRWREGWRYGETARMTTPQRACSPIAPRSAFAGFRFPSDVIVVAVRWYLRFGLSYRDVEELLTDAGCRLTTSSPTVGPAIHAVAGRGPPALPAPRRRALVR